MAARGFRITPGARSACFGRFPGAIDLTADTAGAEPAEVQLHPDDVAALVHTSGSTGPAKAVRYTHGALAAQRHALRSTLTLSDDDAFTTSFGPFMLLAPSLGITSVRPDFPVDDAASLGFDPLAAALTRAPVTTAWLSPASARRIVSTAQGRTLTLPTTLLAGAPISRSLARDVGAITGGEVRAPYGMTECLPVTDGREPLTVGTRGGGCTGRPIEGCDVVIDPLDEHQGWGEILVRAPWMFDGYDGHWHVDASTWVAIDGEHFHRTGDVGYLEEGRLFQLGRRRHVISTERRLLSSVEVEEPVADVLGTSVSAIGIGPVGRQVVCIVVEGNGTLRLASAPLARSVRASAPCAVAAVLEGPLPLDRRHRS
jgi:acyl-CoA synthetase (AMP-forming)/AMP-acid ligase II